MRSRLLLVILFVSIQGAFGAVPATAPWGNVNVSITPFRPDSRDANTAALPVVPVSSNQSRSPGLNHDQISILTKDGNILVNQLFKTKGRTNITQINYERLAEMLSQVVEDQEWGHGSKVPGGYTVFKALRRNGKYYDKITRRRRSASLGIPGAKLLIGEFVLVPKQNIDKAGKRYRRGAFYFTDADIKNYEAERQLKKRDNGVKQFVRGVRSVLKEAVDSPYVGLNAVKGIIGKLVASPHLKN